MIISTTSNLVALTSVDHIHLFLGSEFLEVYIDLSSSSNVKKVIAKSTFCYAISQMIHSGNLAWLGQIKAGLICDMQVLRFQWAVLMARCHRIVTLGLETQSLLIPAKYQGNEGFRRSHPVLLVVAGDETNKLSLDQKRCHLGGCGRDGSMEFQSGFQSAVLMVRCSHQIVALGLEIQVSAAARNLMAYYYSPLWQIHCIDIHLLLRTVFSPIPFLSLEDKEQPKGLATFYPPLVAMPAFKLLFLMAKVYACIPLYLYHSGLLHLKPAIFFTSAPFYPLCGVMVEGFLVLHNWRLRQGHRRNLSVLQTLHSLPPLKAQMKRSRLLQGILELSQISPFEGKVVLTCTGYPW
ncbi:unnamed protein product [Ilex paraguariensis]|uniref:Uncharacterized protein n=1 Tax=Ilex paraguariensis TaxID=185542 RepID=A0ABC8UZM4_9AQUA